MGDGVWLTAVRPRKPHLPCVLGVIITSQATDCCVAVVRVSGCREARQQAALRAEAAESRGAYLELQKANKDHVKGWESEGKRAWAANQSVKAERERTELKYELSQVMRKKQVRCEWVLFARLVRCAPQNRGACCVWSMHALVSVPCSRYRVLITRRCLFHTCCACVPQLAANSKYLASTDAASGIEAFEESLARRGVSRPEIGGDDDDEDEAVDPIAKHIKKTKGEQPLDFFDRLNATVNAGMATVCVVPPPPPP